MVEKRSATSRIAGFEALTLMNHQYNYHRQTLSRAMRMDYAIQKAVEAGVLRIQPLFQWTLFEG